MKFIPLTRGLFAKVDDEDYRYLNQFKWHAHEAARGCFYARGRIEGHRVYMHRVVAKRAGFLKSEIDHRDGDRMNNKRKNLRPASHQNNMRNMHRKQITRSGVKGVQQNRDRWIARLTVNGRQLCFGTYDTIKEAATARREAELKHFGEFANP
jgi:hypothetical protein